MSQPLPFRSAERPFRSSGRAVVASDACSSVSIRRIKLDHTDKHVIRVAGVPTQMRFNERSRRPVDTKQPIFTDLNRWMLWHLEH